MTLEAPVWIEAATGDTAILQSARQYRTVLDALIRKDGVADVTHLAVTQRGAGANFSVDVAAGMAFIAGTDVSAQGVFVVRNTATYNATVTAAPGSGTRTDLVCAVMHDKQASGSSTSQYTWTITVIAGTVGGGVPAVPASALPLAQISVSAGQSSITTANITGLRSIAQAAGVSAVICVLQQSATTYSVNNAWEPMPGLDTAYIDTAGLLAGASSLGGVTIPIAEFASCRGVTSAAYCRIFRRAAGT